MFITLEQSPFVLVLSFWDETGGYLLRKKLPLNLKVIYLSFHKTFYRILLRKLQSIIKTE